MLHRPYFTELFLTMSPARPRLLLAIEPVDNGAWQFYSLPQPQVPYEKSSSLVVTADFHMKFPRDQINFSHGWSHPFLCGYASGLICFSNIHISKAYDNKLVICNPSTGQYAIIPKLTSSRKSFDFLGFDPIDKQFKILSMACPTNDDRDDHQILTLGNGEMMWRKIECPFAPDPSLEAICINGVLHYIAEEYDEGKLVIVCFDVRCEKFKFIPTAFFNYFRTTLINYKGKLGGITWEGDDSGAIELSMWVLEDMEKHEWSKYVYTFLDNKIVNPDDVSVAGVTSTGEIVLSVYYAFSPFYVFYFNPERNTLQAVEIQGNHQVFDKWNRVYIYVDHVEDLNFNIMNATSMSTSTSSKKDHQQQQDRRKFQSINKFDALSLLDDDV